MMLGLCLLGCVVLVASESSDTNIIDSTGKYQDYSVGSKVGKLHKVYDPVTHRLRLLRVAPDKIVTEPHMSVSDRPNKHVVGSVAFRAAERRHLSQLPAKQQSQPTMLNGFIHSYKLKKPKDGKAAKKVEEKSGKKTRTKKALEEMNEDDGAPEQGYDGPIVEHDDGKTHTDDWRREFGPKQKGDKDKTKICREHLERHPDSEWCKKHFRNSHRHSQSTQKSGVPAHTCIVGLSISVALLVGRL